MSTGPESMHGYLTADQGRPPAAEATPPPVRPAVDENVIETETTGFSPGDVQLSKSLPPNVAMLCVTGARWQGEPSFILHFHHRGRVFSAAGDNDQAVQRPPRLALADIDDSGETPWQNAYEEVMSWWASKHRLVTWIRRLLSTADNPRLVVWDNTTHEIPWELFYHEPADDAGPDGWLGELIPVVRWTAIHDGEKAWHYSTRKRECVGGVLMYEDRLMATDPDGYADHEIEPRAASMTDLMARIQVPGRQFGLLVIRCHGEFSRDLRRLKLGGLSLNAYTMFKMRALRQSGAVVLLNACASGRPVIDERHRGAATRSFAELFLRRGAAGVIATTGDIDLNHSHDFAIRLLDEASNGAVNVAEALRRHRRHYATLVAYQPGRNPTEQQFKEFFASFMYVYFGHPDTILRTRRD
jgi:hypothetical protein